MQYHVRYTCDTKGVVDSEGIPRVKHFWLESTRQILREKSPGSAELESVGYFSGDDGYAYAKWMNE